MIKKTLLFVFATILNINSCLALPPGFTYLDELDPSIIKSLRYLGKDNFIGRPVDGYKESRIILTKAAAIALTSAQSIFKEQGYSIVVYDAYRPQSAVNDFRKWSKDTKDTAMKHLFYPRVDKREVFKLGYIAKKSPHSRGSTVDISIISLKEKLHDIIPIPRKLNDGYRITVLDDGTIDMGSSFDLFDEASHYQNDLINNEQMRNRKFLKEVMELCGFKSYGVEWWHFTLKDEPFPDTYFDFPVE